MDHHPDHGDDGGHASRHRQRLDGRSAPVRQTQPTQLFNIILPTYEGDTSVAKYYGGRDQTLNLAVSDANLNAASPTGDRLPAAADNSNQTATNDDRLASTGVVRSPGGFIQRIYYTSCDGDSTGACQSGMDGLDWTRDWMDSGLPGGGMGLAKIDPTGMQFTPQHMKHSFWHFWTGNVGRDTPPPTIYYATKKDGSAWASDNEHEAGWVLYLQCKRIAVADEVPNTWTETINGQPRESNKVVTKTPDMTPSIHLEKVDTPTLKQDGQEQADRDDPKQALKMDADNIGITFIITNTSKTDPATGDGAWYKASDLNLADSTIVGDAHVDMDTSGFRVSITI